jgi:CDP-glucose 4,6-dehydratase
MQSAQPEIVIHMAAQPLVRDSYKIPVETYEINVMGTVNLFEAVRACKTVKAVINVTTDKCYENKEWVWGYRENEPLGGYDLLEQNAYSEWSPPHIAIPIQSERICTHRVGVATCAQNVIGGGLGD